jgi:general secretion pathway protein A
MEGGCALMYEQFYGLTERPFDLTPNPRYLLMTAKHREALSHLEYGVSGRKGITVLMGEAGTGKTTLVHRVLGQQRQRKVSAVYVSNPLLTRDELFEFVALGFDLDRDALASKTRFLVTLTKALVDRHAAGEASALIIDEAQALSHELLEEIRLLANIETTCEKLLPVLLVGQPELADRINDPSLRQLKQRIALRCTLSPLDATETGAYIANRIAVAGGEAHRLFTAAAVAAVFEYSRGIPRTISVICDNALVSGFAADERPIGRATVLEVCRDFDLYVAETAAAATPRASPAAVAPDVRKSSFF